MTDRFTASNGMHVEGTLLRRPSGSPWGNVGSMPALALIEYGRHLERTERDAEFLLAERAQIVGQITTAIRRHCTAPAGMGGEIDALIAFVADWIESPPRWVNAPWVAQVPPKPWLDAKPGEVWVLTIDGREELCFAHQMPHHQTVMFQSKHNSVFGADGTAITAGRRVWPEPEVDGSGS